MSSPITIARLTPQDASALAELLAAYVTETRRGAPRRPDRLYAERLLSEDKVEVLGARTDGRMIGYAIFFDLPETATGRRIGYFDDLYVALDHRRAGVASALLERLRDIGIERNWSEIRWTAPHGSATGRAFSSHRGEPARGQAYRLVLDPVAEEG